MTDLVQANEPVWKPNSSSPLSPVLKRQGSITAPKHVTFSEPEVSEILITGEIYTDMHSRAALSPGMSSVSVENPLTVRRSYLANQKVVEKLRQTAASKNTNVYPLQTRNETWAEMYYDTPASSLSSLECILMKDTRASKYWKFFCFAEDNIMEITTDEKEINEPLNRLVHPAKNHSTNSRHRNFDGRPQRIIDSNQLDTFFVVNNETSTHLTLDDGSFVKLTTTDYGFAWVLIERLCVDRDRLADVTLQIENLAADLGLSNLASYDPVEYL